MVAFFRENHSFLPPLRKASRRERLQPCSRRTKPCSEAGPAATQGNLDFPKNAWVWKVQPLDVQQITANFFVINNFHWKGLRKQLDQRLRSPDFQGWEGGAAARVNMQQLHLRGPSTVPMLEFCQDSNRSRVRS